ncbi:FAD-binding oxidoreductase [Acidimangrovimonas sediminis]|uniref:FAD-binding oxidoreductase n=1 Tax=Acidimangrovimonas sediminis TaxID=2056283 RepID=UPI000C7FC5A6|nr:FAD-binding oxidoreductase [Acidimangrovimonas sediminis]
MLDIKEAITDFSTALRGTLIGRDHPDYDAARKLYNGMIDKHPLLIARCADVADVIAAVKFGRDQGLEIAIRGGGHNGPGLASVSGGLVIDLSEMKGVRVDPANRTVRVGPGCSSGDVDHATHAFGLAVPFGIIASTGVGGLTLGGGTGYLTRKHGLTIDNLLEADVVLADGSFVTASKDRNADLFWALRGGGGNFGVVTSFLFQAHPVSMVLGGPLAWPASQAEEVMRAFRDFVPGAPEDLGLWIGLQTVPSAAPFPEQFWGHGICLVMVCYNGDEVEGRKALAPLLDKVPPPALDWTGMMPFPAVQAMFDPLLPPGLQMYWRGDFIHDVPDAAITAHVAEAAKSPSELSLMHLYPLDGAAARVGGPDTAWSARDARWSMVIVGCDPDPGKAGAVTEWTKTYWDAVHPFNESGGYSNFMMDDEGDDRVRASYGDNYPRLAEIKNKYDPDNLFHVNQNIRPSA